MHTESLTDIYYIIVSCKDYFTKRTLPLFDSLVAQGVQPEQVMFSVGPGIDHHLAVQTALTDNYESAIPKTLNSLAFVAGLKITQQWVALLDDDTFVHVRRMKEFLCLRTPFELEAIGNIGPITTGGAFVNFDHVHGGTGLFVSGKTASVIAGAIQTYNMQHWLNSDVSVAENIHMHNRYCNPCEQISFVHSPNFLLDRDVENFDEMPNPDTWLTCHLKDRINPLELVSKYCCS